MIPHEKKRPGDELEYAVDDLDEDTPEVVGPPAREASAAPSHLAKSDLRFQRRRSHHLWELGYK